MECKLNSLAFRHSDVPGAVGGGQVVLGKLVGCNDPVSAAQLMMATWNDQILVAEYKSNYNDFLWKLVVVEYKSMKLQLQWFSLKTGSCWIQKHETDITMISFEN